LYLAFISPVSRLHLARWAWRRLGVRPPKARFAALHNLFEPSRSLLGAFSEPSPQALFTIPSFHNPTTASASLAALRAVYAACAAHGVVIIEDDPYRMLAFGGEALPRHFLDIS